MDISRFPLNGTKGAPLWVVLSHDRSSVLCDPGLDRPFSTPSRRRAEEVAKEYGGFVVTVREAIEAVTKSQKNFPGNAAN